MPVKIEYLLRGPEVVLRIAMAVQAEAHAERLSMPDLLHFVDFAVAMVATDAPIYMHGMVEIDVIRGFMNLDPRNRFARVVTFANEGQPRVVREDLVVAIHASGRRRDIRVPGFLDAIVAVAAVQSNLVNMNGMRKRDRLDRLVPDTGVLRGEIVPDSGGGGGPHNHRTEDHLARKLVCPPGKNV